MLNRNVLPIRANALRVYVIFNPSATFALKNNEPAEHARIAKEIADAHFIAKKADVRFTKKPFFDVWSDVALREFLEWDIRLLQNGSFGSLWLYGDSTSEFTLDVVNMALRLKMRIVNFSQVGSLLDRYLKSWIAPYGTLF